MVDALKEFFLTRERGAAWIFRGLISAVMVLASIMGTLSWHILTGIENKIDNSSKTVWQAVADINKNQSAAAIAQAQLAQTVADQIRTTSDAIERINKVQDYQEQRLHNLEIAPRH